MFVVDYFLNDGFERMVMLDYFNFNGNVSIEIIFCLFVDSGCMLVDDVLMYSGMFVWGE